MAERLSLSEILGRALDRIWVVDVGAMMLEDEPPPYQPLIKAGVARVIGLAAVKGEGDRLNARRGEDAAGRCPRDRADGLPEDGRAGGGAGCLARCGAGAGDDAHRADRSGTGPDVQGSAALRGCGGGASVQGTRV